MASRRWVPRIASLLSLLGCAALAGCAAGGVSGPVPATAASGVTADDELIADLNDHHRHHHQGGVTMFIALSLDSLGLPADEQAAVTRIQADLFTRMEPSRVAEQAVLTALADGVAAGAIDEARVAAAITELERASGQVHEATVDALNQLHGVLTPAERSALVDKVWAHWAVFQQANAEGDQAGKGSPTGQLNDLAVELGLSTDQVAKVSAGYHERMRAAPGAVDPADVDKHVKRLGEFRADAFDARGLSGGAAANARVAGRGATAMARFDEAASPVLTPEQRTQLAAALREHATHQDTVAVAAH